MQNQAKICIKNQIHKKIKRNSTWLENKMKRNLNKYQREVVKINHNY